MGWADLVGGLGAFTHPWTTWKIVTTCVDVLLSPRDVSFRVDVETTENTKHDKSFLDPRMLTGQ